jgi:hypothetical protein
MSAHALRAARTLFLSLESGWELKQSGPGRWVRVRHGHLHGVKSRTVLLVMLTVLVAAGGGR